jgi:hypothetical protein
MAHARRLLALTLVLISAGACHRHGPTDIALRPGTVLLLPTRNVIQDGKPHPKGVDSGAYFTHSLEKQLVDHGWQVVLTTDARFTNVAIATAEDAIAEGHRLNADYVLRTVLGEFRDAAPMTFRSDFVTLDSAHLWQTRNSALVWSLRGPIDSSGTNLFHYYRLLDQLTDQTANIISKAQAPRELIDGPPRAAVDPLRGLTGGGVPGCTAKQVTTMKNAGLGDEQVRRACEQNKDDR